MNIVRENVFVEPGYIFLPLQPTLLCSVVGSGVAVTLYDRKLKIGGMNHYIRPLHGYKHPTTPLFACPAIIGLVNMMIDAGSRIEDLEANIYGGATNPNAIGFIPELGEQNVQTALFLLARKKIYLDCTDVGSRRGRKIVFNTGTGEVIVAKIDNIGIYEWYPNIFC
jgi:chemotaxis protein CheD